MRCLSRAIEWAGIIADCCALAALALAMAMNDVFGEHHNDAFSLLTRRLLRSFVKLTRPTPVHVTFKRERELMIFRRVISFFT